MQQNNNYGGYQNYDYNDSGYGGYSEQTRNTNLLEIGVVFLSILAILGVAIWGFLAQNDSNKDSVKDFQINQIVQALDYFYVNSNAIPGSRAYPISECSQKLNEVDYEYTLKEYLSGQREKFDTHEYIKPIDFPNDKEGIYSETISQRQVKLRDCPSVYTNVSSNTQLIYTDGTQSCNFNRKDSKFQKCYLYSSTSNGDKYELGYFSESKKAYVVFSKYRAEKLKIDLVAV